MDLHNHFLFNMYSTGQIQSHLHNWNGAVVFLFYQMIKSSNSLQPYFWGMLGSKHVNFNQPELGVFSHILQLESCENGVLDIHLCRDFTRWKCQNLMAFPKLLPVPKKGNLTIDSNQCHRFSWNFPEHMFQFQDFPGWYDPCILFIYSH